MRLRQSTMKQVTPETEESERKWEMKCAKKKMKRLTVQEIGVCPHLLDDAYNTRSNVYKVDGQ